MPRKKHDNRAHDPRCSKPRDDSHMVCPLTPLPGNEWIRVEVVQAGKLNSNHRKVMFAAPGGREDFVITADAADALGAELMRVAAIARKANES